MPFTFSHPAIILPFSKIKNNLFSLTGLIAGSIVPDVEFLMRLRETDCFAHTVWGILIFDLPFSVIVSFVFHLYIRNTLILHLPGGVRQRFTILIAFNWKKYFLKNGIRFFMSVMLGIGSHVFLDAFTHSYGVFVQANSFFTNEIQVMGFSMPLYEMLQWLTTFAGAVYICWFIFKMEKGADLKIKKDNKVYWISIIVVSIILFALRLFADKQHQSYSDIIIAFVGCCMYALVLVSVYYHHYANRKRMKKAL